MHAQGLVCFNVCEKETDLWIAADKNLSDNSLRWAKHYRRQVEDYIKKDKRFLESLAPVKVDKNANFIIKHMASAASLACVGPMASVAGAIAQAVGKRLLKNTRQVIIENGGDIFIVSNTERRFSVYAGNSPFGGKIIFKIKPEQTPCGICTSSGTVGHSLSFGKADAVVVTAEDCVVADAFATSLCNRVKREKDIEQVLEIAKGAKVLTGCIVVLGKKIGIWGHMQIC